MALAVLFLWDHAARGSEEARIVRLSRAQQQLAAAAARQNAIREQQDRSQIAALRAQHAADAAQSAALNRQLAAARIRLNQDGPT
ncbi:MAG TPA: hypothetical protein VKT77_01795, partial [Chthonomonadaceae bacterium]|nr:hypothetical protein [Chthonomonadaceae bacterium]